MFERFHETSAPDPVALPEVTRAGLAAAEAVGVMYGWTCRVLRTGCGALDMHASGLTHEASPLVRSMLEHAMALGWLVDQPADTFQALVRQRQEQIQLLRKAEAIGWQLSDEIQSLMREMLAIETDDSSKSADFLLKVRHRAEKYGHGSLYQAWLIETWSTHASLASANPYLRSSRGVLARALVGARAGADQRPAQRVVAGLVALDAYRTVLPESEKQAMTNDLRAWEARLNEILAVPNADSPGARSVED